MNYRRNTDKPEEKHYTVRVQVFEVTKEDGSKDKKSVELISFATQQEDLTRAVSMGMSTLQMAVIDLGGPVTITAEPPVESPTEPAVLSIDPGETTGFAFTAATEQFKGSNFPSRPIKDNPQG